MARGPKRAPGKGLVEGLIEIISLYVVLLTTIGSSSLYGGLFLSERVLVFKDR